MKSRRMKRELKNKRDLFKLILLSYLKPKSKKKFHQKIKDIYLSVIMKCLALSCLLLTILIWMGINGGLREEYLRFKKDPYTTAIFVTSTRRFLDRDQIERIKIIHYNPVKKVFNTKGKGEEIYDDETISFSSLDLVFYPKERKKPKPFKGRTVNKSDKKILESISQHLIYKKKNDYNLVKDWEDSEKGIIVSKHLVESLGYKVGEQLEINRLIDKRFNNKDHPFPVPVDILAISERMPFGDFIISEEFNYNRLGDTFNPFETVERFYVLTPPEKENELESFVKRRFKYCEEVIRINKDDRENQIRYEIVFKSSIPYYKKEEYKRLGQEASKLFIVKQFENSPFECLIDYYDWKTLPEGIKDKETEFLTLYLKEKYIDLLDELASFLGQLNVEMDDTVLNLFKNYHRDMRRFSNISTVFYFVLISLGIFISIAVYIKSVQATMHRLGVFSAFGISSTFLSSVLAVESVVIFLFSTFFAGILYNLLPLLFIAKEIVMKLSIMDIVIIFWGGSLLSFIVVFLTVRSILKKAPYSLMEYRS